MKKYIILAIALVLLSSCGSSKQILKENLTTQTDSVYLHHDSTAVQIVSKKVETETGTEEVKTTTTTFDTKTTDKDGTHPVLSKTVSIAKKGIVTNKEEKTSQAKQTVNKDSSKVIKKSELKKEATKAKTETTIPKQISGLIWALSVFCVIIIAGYLIYKYKKK
jgi:hypothetical protein